MRFTRGVKPGVKHIGHSLMGRKNLMEYFIGYISLFLIFYTQWYIKQNDTTHEFLIINLVIKKQRIWSSRTWSIQLEVFRPSNSATLVSVGIWPEIRKHQYCYYFVRLTTLLTKLILFCFTILLNNSNFWNV